MYVEKNKYLVQRRLNMSVYDLYNKIIQDTRCIYDLENYFLLNIIKPSKKF